MIIVRRFETTDAQAVSALIAKTLRITNATKFWELSNFLVIQID